jgi:adenosylhomocysteine nucleosidase
MPDLTMGEDADNAHAPQGMPAVLTALPEEAAALRALLSDRRSLRRGRLEISIGRLAGRTIAVASSGDGARNAQLGAEALLAALPVKLLLVIGVSGALSARLEPAELWVGERVLCVGSGEVLQPSAALVELAVRSAGARRAVLVTSPDLADSVAEKRRLLTAAQAGTAAALVDLESACYAAVAQAAHIPWLSLRAVSDGADEALPELLNRCRDQGGAVNRARVLRGLLADPLLLPTLLRLRRRVVRCGAVLARAACVLILATEAEAVSLANSARTDASRTALGARIPSTKRA